LANPAAQDAFGKVDGREITTHAAGLEIFNPDGTPRRVAENPIVRALAGEEIRELEEIVKLPVSGELRTRQVTSIPARGPDGTVLGVVSLVRDVTERAAAVRALKLNRSRLDYATRLSGVGFWYCDLPFDELQWDERVKEHFFFEPTARITIDNFYARIHAEDRGPTRAAIDASIRERIPYDIVYRTVHPTTGKIKWIRALGGTDYASDGTPTHFDGVTVDVSAQKLDQQRLAHLNDQLCEQDRRKDEFLATLSHELRNPLAPIRTSAHILASPTLKPEQLQLARTVIQRQVGRMALLLDDLLDVARITQGKLTLKKERVTLTNVIDSAVEAARPFLDEKHHRLTIDLPSDPVWLEVDSLRLSQVISNLLTNAAKYSNAGGQIDLIVTVEADSVCIVLRDKGIGIAPELLDQIFEMFSQVQEAAERSEGGLGIGLALVKGLVELHGGAVEANSAGPGQGSQFTVRLPRAALAESEETVLTSDASTLPRLGRRVLIADDNKDAADSLAMLLQMGGHDVRVVYNGRAALALAQSFRPDVALLDIGMPELSGFEIATRLRGEPWGTTIQLFALTGWGQDGDRQRTKEAGFDLHLTKPVDLEALEAALLDRPRGTSPQRF
jgi:signal transduction histidine kinase/ActR/RegA family two-component response regulator